MTKRAGKVPVRFPYSSSRMAAAASISPLRGIPPFAARFEDPFTVWIHERFPPRFHASHTQCGRPARTDPPTLALSMLQWVHFTNTPTSCHPYNWCTVSYSSAPTHSYDGLGLRGSTSPPVGRSTATIAFIPTTTDLHDTRTVTACHFHCRFHFRAPGPFRSLAHYHSRCPSLPIAEAVLAEPSSPEMSLPT